jgi:hypothetical protein
VLDAMLPFMTNQFGNPHSRTHAYGWETEKAVDEARAVRLSFYSSILDVTRAVGTYAVVTDSTLRT